MPVVLLPARSHNLAVSGFLTQVEQSVSPADGWVDEALLVINNEHHSSPRQLREERRERATVIA